MQWTSLETWAPRLAAFGMALVLGVAITWWVLHWPEAHSAVPSTSVQAEPGKADAASITRLLGAQTGGVTTAAPLAPKRYQLIGVVARSGGAGSAIIVVDGKPAKSFAVGSKVDDGLVLQSVAPRKVLLAPTMDAAPTQTLELSTKFAATNGKAPEAPGLQGETQRMTPPPTALGNATMGISTMAAPMMAAPLLSPGGAQQELPVMGR